MHQPHRGEIGQAAQDERQAEGEHDAHASASLHRTPVRPTWAVGTAPGGHDLPAVRKLRQEQRVRCQHGPRLTPVHIHVTDRTPSGDPLAVDGFSACLLLCYFHLTERLGCQRRAHRLLVATGQRTLEARSRSGRRRTTVPCPTAAGQARQDRAYGNEATGDAPTLSAHAGFLSAGAHLLSSWAAVYQDGYETRPATKASHPSSNDHPFGAPGRAPRGSPIRWDQRSRHFGSDRRGTPGTR